MSKAVSLLRRVGGMLNRHVHTDIAVDMCEMAEAELEVRGYLQKLDDQKFNAEEASDFTPGPWELQPEQRHHGDEIPVTSGGPGGCVICCVWPMGEDFNEEDDDEWTPNNALANGRLIAAAPEILEAMELAGAALENCLAHFGDKMYPVDKNTRETLAASIRRLAARVKGGAA